MSWSMNEIEALAKKAARGGGQSWGLAEETGKALRCLLEQGIEATAPLAVLLEQNDQADPAWIAPAQVDGVWTAPGGVLCPIAAGTCLSDHAALLQQRGAATLGPTAWPVFLIPFAQTAARLTGQTVALGWQDVTVRANAEGIAIEGPEQAVLLPLADRVSCTLTAHTIWPVLPRVTRASVTAQVGARLNALAHRTYAPATDQDRLSGAGAGLSDND